jgi:HEAT repeat protein
MDAAEEEDLAVLLRQSAIEDHDSPQRWAIVKAVQKRTDRQAFDAACSLARSEDTGKRILGLRILGDIGYLANRPYLEETLPVVLAACDEDRPEVLASAVTALGHLSDVRGSAAALRHVAHPCEDVRLAVAATLPLIAGDPPADEAVAALIGLTRDADPEVRDWATLGLGSLLDVDSAEVRDALAARLGDREADTAGEALLGLALRQDPRALAPILAWLAGDPGNLIVEAAGALGAPEALSALERLKKEGWQDDDPRPSVLDDAIRACTR